MSHTYSFSEKLCLIVEDQKPTSEFLDKLVKSVYSGMDTIIVHDLEGARKWLKDNASSSRQPLGLCLVDLGLPDGSGINVIRELRKQRPEVPAIVVTIHDDDSFLFAALAAGASGYLLKEEEEIFLADALKRFENHQPPLSPNIARRLLRHFQDSYIDEPEIKLSPREKETLELLSQGLTVPEIAKNLKISAQTVAGYVKKIYEKLHVSNRVELMREASRRGLV